MWMDIWGQRDQPVQKAEAGGGSEASRSPASEESDKKGSEEPRQIVQGLMPS